MLRLDRQGAYKPPHAPGTVAPSTKQQRADPIDPPPRERRATLGRDDLEVGSLEEHGEGEDVADVIIDDQGLLACQASVRRMLRRRVRGGSLECRAGRQLRGGSLQWRE